MVLSLSHLSRLFLSFGSAASEARVRPSVRSQWRPPGRHGGFKGVTPVRLDPLGTDDRLHFASFRASDSSFEGTVVTGLVDLVE